MDGCGANAMADFGANAVVGSGALLWGFLMAGCGAHAAAGRGANAVGWLWSSSYGALVSTIKPILSAHSWKYKCAVGFLQSLALVLLHWQILWLL